MAIQMALEYNNTLVQIMFDFVTLRVQIEHSYDTRLIKTITHTHTLLLE